MPWRCRSNTPSCRYPQDFPARPAPPSALSPRPAIRSPPPPSRPPGRPPARPPPCLPACSSVSLLACLPHQLPLSARLLYQAAVTEARARPRLRRTPPRPRPRPATVAKEASPLAATTKASSPEATTGVFPSTPARSLPDHSGKAHLVVARPPCPRPPPQSATPCPRPPPRPPPPGCPDRPSPAEPTESLPVPARSRPTTGASPLSKRPSPLGRQPG